MCILMVRGKYARTRLPEAQPSQPRTQWTRDDGRSFVGFVRFVVQEEKEMRDDERKDNGQYEWEQE